MVMTRLHIICGNCGSNDDLFFRIEKEGHDVTKKETKFEPAVYITCANCSTIHDLNTTMREAK